MSLTRMKSYACKRASDEQTLKPPAVARARCFANAAESVPLLPLAAGRPRASTCDRRSMDADRTSSRRTYCSQFSGGRYCSTSAAVGARGIPKHKCKFDRLPGQPLPTQPSSKAEEIVQSVCCECGHAVISTEHCPDCNASKHDICGAKNDENDTETSARRCSVW